VQLLYIYEIALKIRDIYMLCLYALYVVLCNFLVVLFLLFCGLNAIMILSVKINYVKEKQYDYFPGH